MAGHLEQLLRRVRANLNEHLKLRYKRFTTTSAGNAAGTTVVSTSLTELDDTFNGAELVILDGAAEGQRRVVEDFANLAGTLTFTNNAFLVQIASGVTCELTEKGRWSGEDLKQWLIDSINFLAGVLPKSVLRNYLRKTNVPSTLGVATLPNDILDIHYIQINSKPAIQIPPERASRLISGEDTYLDPTGSDRFLWHLRGASASAAELVHAPAISATVNVHYVPRFSAFDSSGNTTFPAELFEPVVYYATALAFTANEDGDLAGLWLQKTQDMLVARGIKVRLVSKQEGDK